MQNCLCWGPGAFFCFCASLVEYGILWWQDGREALVLWRPRLADLIPLEFWRSQRIAVSRRSDYTNRLSCSSVCYLYLGGHRAAERLCSHPFHGVLKPVSICTVDTLNMYLYKYLKILLFMCSLRCFFLAPAVISYFIFRIFLVTADRSGWKNREKEERKREREKEGKRARKRQGLVVLGSGEENSRVLFGDADQKSETRMRKSALRTGRRQAVE
ncbi:hypothetical protein TNCV_4765611 [Trichonephila clavipes]|nr:hypothetical protein TNCV_4765611 [Trichonephila clavipes]